MAATGSLADRQLLSGKQNFLPLVREASQCSSGPSVQVRKQRKGSWRWPLSHVRVKQRGGGPLHKRVDEHAAVFEANDARALSRNFPNAAHPVVNGAQQQGPVAEAKQEPIIVLEG